MRRGPGLALFAGLLVVAGAAVAAAQLGLWQKLEDRFFPRARQPARLSAGDFPAGAAAPIGEIASVPLRPTVVGFVPRGSSAAVLLVTGGIASDGAQPRAGIARTGYAMEVTARIFTREEELRDALARGGDAGGVDFAVMTVDRLAHWSVALRDAAPRTVLLLGRSQGQEAIAAVGVNLVTELHGKRLALHPNGPAAYFAYWTLARNGLGLEDVRVVELPSALDAGRALREGRADAAAGFLGDLEQAAKDRGGKILSTTVDAPHLIASVLVARGDYAARYPDGVRRLLRALLDAAGALAKDPTAGARLLGEVAPYLGDPAEAIKSARPARVHENLAFFGLAGEAPVTYDELFDSAAQLYVKLRGGPLPPRAADTKELGALKYVAEARGL